MAYGGPTATGNYDDPGFDPGIDFKKPAYLVMGVPFIASRKDVKKAFRHLASRFHPDKKCTGKDDTAFNRQYYTKVFQNLERAKREMELIIEGRHGGVGSASFKCPPGWSMGPKEPTEKEKRKWWKERTPREDFYFPDSDDSYEYKLGEPEEWLPDMNTDRIEGGPERKRFLITGLDPFMAAYEVKDIIIGLTGIVSPEVYDITDPNHLDDPQYMVNIFGWEEELLTNPAHWSKGVEIIPMD